MCVVNGGLISSITIPSDTAIHAMATARTICTIRGSPITSFSIPPNAANAATNAAARSSGKWPPRRRRGSVRARETLSPDNTH